MNKQDIAEQAYINGYKKGVEDFAEKFKEKCCELQKRYSHICGSKYEAIQESCRYEGVTAVKNSINEIVKELTEKPENGCKHALKDELGDLYCGNDKSEHLGDFCVACGKYAGEGRQICVNCEVKNGL